jgi:hypothetical protein
VRALIFSSLLLLGCEPALGPSARASWPPRWKMATVEHRVAFALQTAHQSRRSAFAFHGVLDVRRPDWFHLLAYHAVGVAFEIIGDGGRLRVLQGTGPWFSEKTRPPGLLESIAADIGAAYALSPAAGARMVAASPTEICIREGAKTIWLSQFQQTQGASFPTRIDIDHPGQSFSYQLTIRNMKVSIRAPDRE